ncbi:site-2 protease family protein [uncultured Jatrophihabitans sp.]|uniref:site-2 protease family protein n=1 Tax=uncultured Jatrophihabitans sp. TaxID=1610747 RepID=UPI0035CBB495
MSSPPTSGRPRAALQLARVWGVPIVVTPSWLLIAVLLTASYGPIVRDAVPGTTGTVAYLASLGFALLFGLCIIAHELGHTLVSRALGYSVTRITLFLLGGVSEIDGEPRRARDELLISGAGPLVSAGVAAAAFGGYASTPHGSLAEVLFLLLAWSNAVLVAFNLLPGLPLDGGRLLRAVIWGIGGKEVRSTRVAGWMGRALAVLIAVSGLIVDRTSAGVAAGIVTLFLAVYLWSGASAAIRVADVQQRLPLVRVSDLLRPGLLVPSTATVDDALQRAWAGNVRGIVLTDAAERPTAIVDERLISAVPPPRRPWTRVADVARPLDAGTVLPVDIAATDLLDRMREHPAREYLMLAADGSPAGIITTADFARLLNTKPPA